MNFSIEIKAPELANAILTLAQSLGGVKAPAQTFIQHQPAVPTQQPVQQAPVQQPNQQTGVPVQQPIQQAPVQQPVQQPTQQAPIQQPPTQPAQEVPTSAPTYTMDQLAVAATQLMDAGRREEIMQLLSQFNVQALTMLPKEQYGAFATALREKGAKI